MDERVADFERIQGQTAGLRELNTRVAENQARLRDIDTELAYRSELGEGCRFANCLHLREPDCAVKTAVDNGTISARRYESYMKIREE